MIEINVKRLSTGEGREFLLRAFAEGEGKITSRHPANHYEHRDLILTAVDDDPKDLKDVGIAPRDLYARCTKVASEAISEGKPYLRSPRMGIAFKMELRAL